MSSLRVLKKDIDYLVEELVSDCYLSVYFHSKSEDAILALMSEAIAFRNDIFERINNPAEKNNPKLIKKHYAQIRREMFAKVDELFEKLSVLCK